MRETVWPAWEIPRVIAPFFDDKVAEGLDRFRFRVVIDRPQNPLIIMLVVVTAQNGLFCVQKGGDAVRFVVDDLPAAVASTFEDRDPVVREYFQVVKPDV